MKNSYWNLVWGVIGVCIIANTFLQGMKSKSLFGFEINIWVYRAIWLFISAGNLFSFFKRQKENSN